VPAKDRLNTWTLGGIAIDQVSKYKYLGVVYQEDGSWQAHAQRRACKDASSLWVLGPCCHAAVCRQRSTAHGSDLHLFPRSCMARKCGDDEGGQDKMSAVVKLSQHSSPASRDCSSDVLYGTLGYFHPYSLMLPNCGSTDARTWRPMAQEALRFSFEGSRGVGRPKVARTGAVMSNPLLSRSSTP
jgi:hypothetical protein